MSFPNFENLLSSKGKISKKLFKIQTALNYYFKTNGGV